MRFPPEAYMIGAQKAGTTTLAVLLDQHPRITLSSPKEAAFFTRHWEKGLDWYAERFDAPDDAILIDATPAYATAPVLSGEGSASLGHDVPKRIHSVRPDAKFIYVLRDPVERTYSSYWHAVRAGYESRPLEEALSSSGNYVATSCYYRQLLRYYEYFSPDVFLILDFRELCRDASGVAQKCAAFLNATPVDFSFTPIGSKNQSFQYNSIGRLVQSSVGGSAGMSRLTNVIKAAIPKRFHAATKRILTREVPKMTDHQRAMISALFEQERKDLKQATGFQF